MKVEIRKIKRAWAYCDTDPKHGKTPYELIVKSDNSIQPFRDWLCQECLVDFRQQFDREICKLRDSMEKK